jgi:hypothetical protein
MLCPSLPEGTSQTGTPRPSAGASTDVLQAYPPHLPASLPTSPACIPTHLTCLHPYKRTHDRPVVVSPQDRIRTICSDSSA